MFFNKYSYTVTQQKKKNASPTYKYALYNSKVVLLRQSTLPLPTRISQCQQQVVYLLSGWYYYELFG